MTYVAEGTISEQDYMDKLEQFVTVRTNQVKETSQKLQLLKKFQETAAFYK